MGECYICGEETDKGKRNFGSGEWIYLCSRACDDEYDPYRAESFEAEYDEILHDEAEVMWWGTYTGTINVPTKQGKQYYANFDIVKDPDFNAESFDADWDNAPYGSWDEAWSDQVTFTQRKGYFRPRNLALAGIAYWMAMKLRK